MWLLEGPRDVVSLRLAVLTMWLVGGIVGGAILLL